MKKKILLIIVAIILTMPTYVSAAWYCEYSTLSMLKARAANINTTYEYYMKDDKPVFKFTITNIYKSLILYDSTNDKYYYPDTKKDNSDFTIDGFQSGNSYKFVIYTTEPLCEDRIIYTFYITTPSYNPYYLDPLCSRVPDYKLCQKWSNTGLTYDNFKVEMNNYLNESGLNDDTDNKEDELPEWLKFYLQYYMIISPTIIIVCIGIIYSYIKNDDFDF